MAPAPVVHQPEHAWLLIASALAASGANRLQMLMSTTLAKRELGPS
jgi:hypothetical protein